MPLQQEFHFNRVPQLSNLTTYLKQNTLKVAEVFQSTSVQALYEECCASLQQLPPLEQHMAKPILLQEHQDLRAWREGKGSTCRVQRDSSSCAQSLWGLGSALLSCPSTYPTPPCPAARDLPDVLCAQVTPLCPTVTELSAILTLDTGKTIPSQALTAADEGSAALALTAMPLFMSLIGA